MCVRRFSVAIVHDQDERVSASSRSSIAGILHLFVLAEERAHASRFLAGSGRGGGRGGGVTFVLYIQ